LEGDRMKFVEPVKNAKEIDKIKKLLAKKRDILLFTMGINSSLRISDLLSLKITDVWEDGKAKDSITIKEAKTSKTKNFPLNDSIKKALKDYLSERKDVQPEEVLFLSRKKKESIKRCQAWKIIRVCHQLQNT
jgi:integrase